MGNNKMNMCCFWYLGCNNLQKLYNFAFEILNMMSISDWIDSLPPTGQYTFTKEDIAREFPSHSAAAVHMALSRKMGKKRIFSPHRGFYVIVRDEYRGKKTVPQIFYIDQLMAYLGKKYYVSLLSAASMHGAAHQSPMTFYVMTEAPKLRDKETETFITRFSSRSVIPERYVEVRTAYTGWISVSSPELTAVDLISYQHTIGGLTRACTVLSELVDKVNFAGVGEDFIGVAPVASLQRLGYLLEQVLEERDAADALFDKMTAAKTAFQYIPLKQGRSTEGFETDRRWKVIVNQDIEIDEL